MGSEREKHAKWDRHRAGDADCHTAAPVGRSGHGVNHVPLRGSLVTASRYRLVHSVHRRSSFLSSVPDFVARPVSAVSGRLIWRPVDPGFDAVPAVLEAHLLPGLIGSSVYVLGAVGPSDTSWPYFPLGGAVLSAPREMAVLRHEDDSSYRFELDGSFSWDDEDFDFDAPDDPDDLVEVVFAHGADALGLHPWDDALVAEVVEECMGTEYFDQFMALSLAEFRRGQGPAN